MDDPLSSSASSSSSSSSSSSPSTVISSTATILTMDSTPTIHPSREVIETVVAATEFVVQTAAASKESINTSSGTIIATMAAATAMVAPASIASTTKAAGAGVAAAKILSVSRLLTSTRKQLSSSTIVKDGGRSPRRSPERSQQFSHIRSRSLERLSTEKSSKRLQTLSATPYVYKYKLLPGNNGRVLLGALRKRPWWHATSKVDAATTDYDQNGEMPNFVWEMYRNPKRYKDDCYVDVILNHVEHNNGLVTKKGLYLTLKAYCDQNKDVDLLGIIPRTYYLPSGPQDALSGDMRDFLEFNKQAAVTAKSGLTAASASTTASATVGAGEGSGSSGAQVAPGGDAATPEPSAEDGDAAAVSAADTAVAASASASASGSVPVTATTAEPVAAAAGTAREGVDKGSPQGLVWILKPASRTNRGFGITVVRGVEGVMGVISRPASGKKDKEKARAKREGPETEVVVSQSEKLAQQAGQISRKEGWIVQLYMDRPMLVSGRKFDIRCYVLVTKFGKQGLRAYFFREAYVRTSSKKYSLTSLSDREAHLTNDAVQKNSKTYGKFEDGNKLSFEQWQETILRDYPHAPSDIVEKSFRPEFRRLSALSIAAAAEEMSRTSINKSFELLGYDFMIDEDFKSYMIEINSNPCLEFVCPLLTDIITSLIENVVRVALDPQCPPAPKGQRTNHCDDVIAQIEENEVMFDQIYPLR